MDCKYFILILFCQYLNNTFFSETEAITTEKQLQTTLFTSSVPYASNNSENPTGNVTDRPTHFNNISSGQPLPAKVTAGQPTPATYSSSGKPASHIVAGLPAHITTQAIPTSNTSSQQTALSGLTSSGQPLPSTHISTRKPPRPSFYNSTQRLPLSAQSYSGNLVHNVSTKPTSTVYLSRAAILPKNTPSFTSEPTNSKEAPRKTSYGTITAILIGTIMISMLVAIIMIILWKYFRKPVSNDQNWAGRSPFADGETPDICMDNIRENEVSTKRTSIVSLMTWKPNKSTLLADDLEVKLFESSEHIEDANNLKAENLKDQVNGVSEDSADGSTIGTAVSTSDDADLDADKPTMTTASPPTNDCTALQPSLDIVNQVCDDHNPETKQSFPPPPDSFNLLLSPSDVMNNQQDSCHEIPCQFSFSPDPDQDLSLPPPPVELL